MMKHRTISTLVIILFHLCAQIVLAQDMPNGNGPEAVPGLSGTGNGGDLCLVSLGGRTPKLTRVPVGSGESVPQALGRLFASASSCFSTSLEFSKEGTPHSDIPGDLFGGDLFSWRYVLAGSETGFSIPPAPLSLTCSYDKEAKQLRVQWDNHQVDFDQIFVVLGVLNWQEIDDGGTESASLPLNQGDDQTVAIVGYRGGVPSNCGVIALQGTRQVEFFSYPFLRGVAPNWSSWGSTSIQFVQIVKDEYRNSYLDGCLSREEGRATRFAQQLKSSSAEASGGVMRKFIGLNGGHSYRVVVRTSTLDMPIGAAAPDWRYSLHAAYTNTTHGNTLSPEQLSGQATLPDGTTGESAGRFALFDNSQGTDGRWEKCSTGIERPGKVIGDVVLPDDASTIVVWVRYQSSVSDDSGVAFDYLELEDLGPTESSIAVE